MMSQRRRRRERKEKEEERTGAVESDAKCSADCEIRLLLFML